MKADPRNNGQGMLPQSYEQRELMLPGHQACPGCGAAMALRMALKALGPETVLVVPSSCMTFSLGPFPYTALAIPVVHSAAGTAAATACGVRASLDLQGRQGIAVVAWADMQDAGGQGMARMVQASQQGEEIIFVCCDTTPPDGRPGRRRADTMAMFAACNPSYLAGTTPALPHDLFDKFKKARSAPGFRLIHITAACPDKWRIDPSESVKAMREAAFSDESIAYESPLEPRRQE